ncbi:MAG TPA: hypothetical protein PK455_05115 [Caldisericia bacterium]|nr:hypothetical protein [Caldisericia bacterium]
MKSLSISKEKIRGTSLLITFLTIFIGVFGVITVNLIFKIFTPYSTFSTEAIILLVILAIVGLGLTATSFLNFIWQILSDLKSIKFSLSSPTLLILFYILFLNISTLFKWEKDLLKPPINLGIYLSIIFSVCLIVIFAFYLKIQNWWSKERKIEITNETKSSYSSENIRPLLFNDPFIINGFGIPFLIISIIFLVLMPYLFYELINKVSNNLLRTIILLYYSFGIFLLYLFFKFYLLDNEDLNSNQNHSLGEIDIKKHSIFVVLLLLLFVFTPYALSRGFNLFVTPFNFKVEPLFKLYRPYIGYTLSLIVITLSYLLFKHKSKSLFWVFLCSILQQISVLLFASNNLYISKILTFFQSYTISVDNMATSIVMNRLPILLLWCLMGGFVILITFYVVDKVVTFFLKKTDKLDFFFNPSKYSKKKYFSFLFILNLLNTLRAIFFV